MTDNNEDEKIIVYVDPDLEESIPKFMEYQNEQLSLVKLALKNLDYSELKRLGRQIRESCDGYGFSIIEEFGERIEHSAEAQSPELLSLNIVQLEMCVAHLKIEYRRD